MIVVSLLALAANAVTRSFFERPRVRKLTSGRGWIFTANDIKVNALDIVSAVIVALTISPIPDLLAGAAIFVIVANGARRILRLAR